MLTSSEISEANKFPIRKVGQKLAVGWEKAMLPTEGFFVLDQSELDGADVLAWNDEKPFNPAHAYELNDVSRYVKHVNFERGVDFPYAVQSAVADVQLVNHERMYSGAPYNYPARPLRLWGGLENMSKNVMLGGVTERQSYSGKQLLTKNGMATPSTDTTFWRNFATVLEHTPLGDGWAHFRQNSTGLGNLWVYLSAVYGMVANSVYTVVAEFKNVETTACTFTFSQTYQNADPFGSVNVITGATITGGSTERRFSADETSAIVAFVGTTKSSLSNVGLRFFTGNSTAVDTSFDLRVSILAGDHSADYQNYIGANWQPYVGGVPSPNPDHPQAVKTVTGLQTVSVGGEEYEINLGKNIFDKNNAEVVNGYIQDRADQFVIQNGNSDKTILLKVMPNSTYAISKSGGNRFRAFTMPDEITSPGTYTVSNLVRGNDAATTLSINTGSDRFLYIHITADDTVIDAILDSLQVELGSAATDYVPYFTPIELCKIGNYQDEIRFENGEWSLISAVGQYVYDGSESWSSGPSGTSTGYAAFQLAGDALRPSDLPAGRPQVISDCFLWSNRDDTLAEPKNHIYTYASSSGIKFFTPTAAADTVAKWSAFIANLQPTIYYPRKSVVVSAITNESLISQLNAVRDAAIKRGVGSATAQGNLAAEIAITTTSDGTMTLTPLFEGFTTDIPSYAGRDEREMSLNAMDSLYEICNQDLPNMFMATNLRTDEIIRQILVDELGVGDYLLDFEEGDVTVPFVWFEAGKDVGNALKDVVQVENGRLWVDETGKIRFSKQGLNELTTPAVEHFDSSNIISITTLSADRLINECRVECGIREVQSRQMVYSEENESGYSQTADNDPYRIAGGATSTFWIQLEDPCTSVDTPLIRTARSDVASYFVAVRVSDGTAQASGLSVDEFTTFGDRILLKVANSNNYALSIREIKLWGTPARVVQTVDYTAKDNDSIKAYGRRPLEIDGNELWGSAENIRDYARKIVQRGADFEQNLEAEVRSNLLLQVGDVVTVKLDDWEDARRFAIESVMVTIDSPENCAIKQTLKLVATADEEE